MYTYSLIGMEISPALFDFRPFLCIRLRDEFDGSFRIDGQWSSGCMADQTEPPRVNFFQRWVTLFSLSLTHDLYVADGLK